MRTPGTSTSEARTLSILGTRGVPAAHGGFETFAERLAVFLVARGWTVRVYCQRDVDVVARRISSDTWRGIERVNIEVAARGPLATLAFDAYSVLHAARQSGTCLVLGYNSGLFIPWLRLAGRKILTNMDGIEWRRAKWSRGVKMWFWVNEWIAAWASHRIVADHPAIADHLATRRPRAAAVMIPYGGEPVSAADPAVIASLGLEPDRYFLSVARIEPDNNILTLVEAFSRAKRDARLVVLGSLDEGNSYHRRIKAAASDEVLFPGGIYEPERLRALRFHALAYLHGHTVGGTNPSLVEALWAGNAVIAHDNRYNRWTAGDAGLFFRNGDDLERLLRSALDGDPAIMRARAAARARAEADFQWSDVLSRYAEELLTLGGVTVIEEAASEPVGASAQLR